MNSETIEFYKKEILDLLDKKLIRKGKSPWSCAAFYDQKMLKLTERLLAQLLITNF